MNEISQFVGVEPWLLKYNRSPHSSVRDGQALSLKLRSSDAELSTELKSRGLVCIDPEKVGSIAKMFDHVERLLECAPNLGCVVRTCVQEILLLRAPDHGYDVSFSEPRWSNRIFVSVPRPSELSNLRLAEAVVHEAMHLNLTNLERRHSLISKNELLSSPWRQELRPVTGVLHGLYVFICVHRFLQHLESRGCHREGRRKYVKRRQAQIADQVVSVDHRLLHRSLSPEGMTLHDELMKFANYT